MYGTIIIGLAILALLCIYDRIKNRRLYQLTGKFPGPPSIPVIGNSKDFAADSHEIFKTVLRFAKEYGRFYRLWNGGRFYLMCSDYKDAEVILGSTVHIKKSESYKFVHPWIGDGVLTATGALWKRHRKAITPAFHFKVLQDFLEIFNRKTEIFCQKLSEREGGEEFDIYNYVKLLALDNIYETAMGMNMEVQKHSDSDYVQAVKDMCFVASQRFYKVWLMADATFNISKYAKIQQNALKILHKTTEDVIKRKLGEQSHSKVSECEDNEDDKMYTHKKRAFLDLLLRTSEASDWTEREFREEVDTILFAGHDTVSSGISFVLYCLANYPEVQEKVYQEQMEIFGDSDRLPTSEDIQEMKYLERVIKEAQRMYPSAPIVGRELEDDVELPGGVIVPSGTQLNILIYSIHRDPRIWKNPETFNPDNFLPEEIQSRPPYSYIPFSAGPRNCLGQKYAMLEIKSTVGIAVRKYKFLPSLLKTHDPLLAAEIILVSKNGIHLRIKSRSSTRDYN